MKTAIGAWVVMAGLGVATLAAGCGQVSSGVAQSAPVGGHGGEGPVASGGETAPAGATSVLAGAGGSPDDDAGPALGGASAFPAVDPEVSRRYTWQACGAIAPTSLVGVQVQFLPGRDSAVALYDDGSLRVHSLSDVGKGSVLRPAGLVPESLAFSLDGNQIAELSGGGVWVSRSDGTGPRTLMQPNSACVGSRLQFSAEGTDVMAWSGSSVCVWRVADGALWRTLAGSFQSAGVAANRLMTFEPGPLPIVTNRALSAEFYTEIPLEIPAGRALDADNLLAFAISPRLDAFVGLDRQGNAYLWSGDGQLSTSFPVTEPGSVQFSPTGSVALVGDQLLDVGSGRHQTNAAFDLNDGFIDWGVDDAGAQVTRLTQRGEVEIADLKLPDMHRLFTSLGRDARPRLLAVSPDGSRLIVLGLDQDLAMLWRLADAFSESVPLREMREGLPILASFSPDSKELLVSGDGWIRVAAETGKLLSRSYPLPNVPTDCWFTSASFATRNGQLAVGDYSRSIGIFRLDAATPIATLNTPRCNGRAVFNADSSLVATSGPALFRSSDWTELWAAPISPPHFDTGALDLNALDDIQFSPGDQTLLLSHCPDQNADCDHALYSAKTGALVETLPTLHAAQASYSTEGNWIVSGNALLHLPTHESLDFAPSARLSTFAPNGDIISVLEDNTLARFCRVH